MMKNIFKLLILLIIVSCSNQKEFTISGKTDRVGDALLFVIEPNNYQIDTTNIKNGQFIFKKVIEEEELFRLKFYDGTSFDLLVMPGEKITVDFKEQNLSIKGSVGSEKLMDLDQSLNNLMAFRDSISKELQQLSRSDNYEEKMLSYRELFFEKLEIHKEFIKNFIENNESSKACLIALFQTYGPSSPVLTVDEDLIYFEKVLENLKTTFPKSKHIKLLEEQIEKLKPLAYGQMAPNFTLPDLNKNQISLSEFRGKVLLLDFWASWCKPCRIENPQLVKLYQKYSGLGFDILSISLDGTQRQKDPEKKWKQAIEEDNLSAWTHLSELKGWQTSVRELYNFNSIPYTILIDQDGKIIGKNLKKSDLEIKIKNTLSNNGKK